MEKISFKEHRKQKSLPCRDHIQLESSFIWNEVMSSSENSQLDFQNYQYPFKNYLGLDNNLLNTICSFLNLGGGTILIGVDDLKRVVGVELEGQQIDETKRYFYSLTKRLYPLPEGFIEIVEVPVKEPVGKGMYRWVPNTYVIRIQVAQGQVNRFYTFKNDQQQYCSSIREDAYSLLISSFERIMENIFSRSQCPNKVANIIRYENPDQDGLSEGAQIIKPSLYQEETHYIVFTNIFCNCISEFIRLLTTKLNELQMQFVFDSQWDGFILVTGPQLIRLFEAIQRIYNANKDIIKSLTLYFKDLKFGIPNKIITVQILKSEHLPIIKEVSQAIKCSAFMSFSLDGEEEIHLTEIDSFEDFLHAFTYLKRSNLQPSITYFKH